MSKLIVEMEMPKYRCADCDLSIDGFACKKARMDGGKCPICGVLPDEHGDLIDRDELKNNLWSEHAYYYNRTDAAIAVQACMVDVEISKAVIKAERKDDDKQRSNIYS